MRCALFFALASSACGLGNRYTIEDPKPTTRAAAVQVRALELELSNDKTLTVRLAVSGVDGKDVRLDPHAIVLGEGAAPQSASERFGAAMAVTGNGVILLFPFQAALYGMGAAAEAIDEATRLLLEPGERLIVLRYQTVMGDGPITLHFDGSIGGADAPGPLALLSPERPHQGLRAPEPAIGTFGAFLGGGPVWLEEDAPLGRGLVPNRAQAGIELYGGWRLGRLQVLAVSRLLGLGTTLGLDLRVSALRTEWFELTPFVGYGFTLFADPKQLAAQVGRLGFNTSFYLRQPDRFGFTPRLLGLGLYAHGSGQWVLGRLRPALEVGVSVNCF